MNISTNLATPVLTFSLGLGMQKRFYRLDASTTQKLNWNLRGTRILSQAELDEAPKYLYKTLCTNLDKKNISNVEECIRNMKMVFSAITKQKTLFDVKEPFIHEEIAKFYTDDEIQELLKKISLFANHLLKNDSKKALNLLESGLRMRSDLPTSEIAIKLKCQYGIGLLLRGEKTLEEINTYLLNLADDAENSGVSPNIMALVRNLQGFVTLRKAMDISNLERHNGYKIKSAIKQFSQLKLMSKFYFQEAAKLDPENKMHKINELAVQAFLFGTVTSTSNIELSKSGTIKLLQTLENFLGAAKVYSEEGIYLMHPISAGVYHDLAKLRDQIIFSKYTSNSPFLNATSKVLEQEKPLPAEKGETVLEKSTETVQKEPKTIVEVLNKAKARKNSKKIISE